MANRSAVFSFPLKQWLPDNSWLFPLSIVSENDLRKCKKQLWSKHPKRRNMQNYNEDEYQGKCSKISA